MSVTRYFDIRLPVGSSANAFNPMMCLQIKAETWKLELQLGEPTIHWRDKKPRRCGCSYENHLELSISELPALFFLPD